MMIPVLYEDGDVMVIDKPSGIVTNAAASVKSETVQDWAEKHIHAIQVIRKQDIRTDIEQVFVDRSGVAHRLDKDTSGCLIIAKHPAALADVLRQFKDRTVKKEYVALVHGAITPASGTITAPIGRLAWRRGLFGVMPGGKHAVTHYRVKSYYQRGNERYSLVSVTIETGRTHQIRVHLQYSNHPVVGDVFYAGRKRTRTVRVWCPRLFLHAQRIAFSHPIDNSRINITSPLPAELVSALDELQPAHEKA